MAIQIAQYQHRHLGRLQLHFEQGVLVRLDLPYAHLFQDASAALPNIWQEQLDAYFAGELTKFTGRLHLQGTQHDLAVWHSMQNIAYAHTLSYGEVAKRIGSCAQAVGQACKRNPIPIIVACHRITAKNHLGGYSGSTNTDTLSIKHWLLEHERSHAH